MAVQTEVKLVCDYCMGKDQGVQRAVRTRRWALDGQQYEVEVCEKHDTLLDKDAEVWRTVSRKAGTKAREIGRRSAAKSTTSRAGEAYDKGDYLKWAEAKGYNVNPNGRPNPRLLRRFLDETKPATV